MNRLLVAVMALLGAAVLVPVLRFLLLPVLPGLAPAFAPPTGPLPGLGAAALGSVLVATASGLLAAGPATALGFLLEHRRWAGRRLCAGACWAALLLPGYLLVAGWEIVLEAGGGTASRGRFGPAGDWLLLVGAMAARGLPLAVLAARIGWSVLPPALEDAARVNLRGASGRVRLLLAAAAPIVLLAFLLCFDQAMDEYGIASVLGRRLHLRLLAAEVSTDLLQWPVSWPRAATCADLMVAAALLPFLLRWRSWRDVAGPGPAVRGPRTIAGAWTCVLAWALFALLAVPDLLVPVLALGSDLHAGLSGWSMSSEGARGLLWSTCYGLVAATAAIGLAAAVLGGTADGSSRTLLFRVLPLFTLSVPGIVLGAAFVIGYGGAPVPVLGTPVALLLADVATTLPIGLLALREAMGRCMRLRGDAARVHGVGRTARIERIHAPALLLPLTGAWCLCFCRLFFELPLAQMLAPAGREPVGIVLVGLGESLRLADEAVLACAGMAVCGAVVLAMALGTMLLAGRQR